MSQGVIEGLDGHTCGVLTDMHRYFDKKTVGLDFQGMKADIEVSESERSRQRPALSTLHLLISCRLLSLVQS